MQVITNVQSFRQLMMKYSCACLEIETKLNVLNAEFSLTNDRNPFESIHSRIKTPQSILEKMNRKGIELTVENIEKYLSDVAGVRVICSFPEDVYTVRQLLLKQDDIRLLVEKDYIAHPKENGYRSLHLIVEVPIFLSEEKRFMKVEVQLRTIAMDFWASLEHKLKYKKSVSDAERVSAELKECADASAALDLRMQQIERQIDG
ncbi:MAG: GTP pyrophosphokinase family protein [Eubacteriales bacterium]|nr:GTP pyrophosphokinase family protein [Eubacteriales bacterium]